jgi:acetyltransferase
MKYRKEWQNNRGIEMVIRAICPQDEGMMVHFHESLSDTTVYMRYFHPMKLSKRVSHTRLARICTIDYDMEMVLVAEKSREGDGKEIVGVSRMNRIGDGKEGEVALVISDQYHGQGIGTEMIRCLVEIGREKQMSLIYADILPENRHAQTLFRNVGFRTAFEHDEGIIRARLKLA